MIDEGSYDVFIYHRMMLSSLKFEYASVIIIEVVFKIILSFHLDGGVMISPNFIKYLDSMYFITLPSYDGSIMEEKSVFITKFDPFVTRILELMDFLLEENVVIISLKFLLK